MALVIDSKTGIIMKTYIVYALSFIILCSCTVESADSPTYSEKALDHFASEVVEDKVQFPMSVLETVLLIQDYEEMSAEEKVNLTHIFSSLIKVSDQVYTMNKFYNLKVSTDGQSIYEDGAEWSFQTDYALYNYTPRSYRLYNDSEESGHDYIFDTDVKDSPQSKIIIEEISDDSYYFSWKFEVEGWFESDQGRSVHYRSKSPVTRKVARSSDKVAESMITTTGSLIITIYDIDGKQLEEITYDMSGTTFNTFYKF